MKPEVSLRADTGIRSGGAGVAATLAVARRRGRTSRLTTEQLALGERALPEGSRVSEFRGDFCTALPVGIVSGNLTEISYHPGDVWRIRSTWPGASGGRIALQEEIAWRGEEELGARGPGAMDCPVIELWRSQEWRDRAI